MLALCISCETLCPLVENNLGVVASACLRNKAVNVITANAIWFICGRWPRTKLTVRYQTSVRLSIYGTGSILQDGNRITIGNRGGLQLVGSAITSAIKSESANSLSRNYGVVPVT